MRGIPFVAEIARLREKARRCRRAAFAMEPSVARDAIERIAARWDLIAAAAEATPAAANDP